MQHITFKHFLNSSDWKSSLIIMTYCQCLLIVYDAGIIKQ